jgi:hypothetical protein
VRNLGPRNRGSAVLVRHRSARSHSSPRGVAERSKRYAYRLVHQGNGRRPQFHSRAAPEADLIGGESPARRGDGAMRRPKDARRSHAASVVLPPLSRRTPFTHLGPLGPPSPLAASGGPVVLGVVDRGVRARSDLKRVGARELPQRRRRRPAQRHDPLLLRWRGRAVRTPCAMGVRAQHGHRGAQAQHGLGEHSAIQRVTQRRGASAHHFSHLTLSSRPVGGTDTSLPGHGVKLDRARLGPCLTRESRPRVPRSLRRPKRNSRH